MNLWKSLLVLICWSISPHWTKSFLHSQSALQCKFFHQFQGGSIFVQVDEPVQLRHFRQPFRFQILQEPWEKLCSSDFECPLELIWSSSWSKAPFEVEKAATHPRVGGDSNTGVSTWSKRLLFWANLLGVVECYEARNMRDACVCIYILGSRWGANTNPKTSGCASGRANTHKLRFKLVCEACRSQLSQLILNRSGYLTINVGGCGNRKSGDLGDT